MLKPLPARLLRYVLYLCAGLLICVTILLWQAPNLIQRHLPGWLATHYGLQLTLGKIEVGLRSPSLTLGPSALLDERQHPLVSFDGLRLIPKLKESWRQRALVLEELTLTAPRVALVRLADNKGEARFNLTEVLAPPALASASADATGRHRARGGEHRQAGPGPGAISLPG